ncbi:MAG TPA: helix-turn-helix domain-containing protein, partial [Solirubrobacteraceae bacterium]
AATPLYVRLAADPARALEEAVAQTGKSKRQIVEDAVSEHLTVGRVALQEKAPEVLTAPEAAALLRVAEADLIGAAEAGELPGRRIGAEWRFSREALLAALATAGPRAGGRPV